MKHFAWTRMVAAVAMLAAPALVNAQTIGPDGFGYTLTRTNNPGAFTTIAGNPSTIALTTNAAAHDDEAFPVPIPFAFSAYGTSYSTMQVCTNGFILLGALSATTFTNADLTTTITTANIQNSAGLFPYWDDMFFFAAPNTGALLTLTRTVSGRQQQVVQWDQVGYFGGSAADLATFQAIVQDDGKMFYVYSSVGGPAGQSQGGSASVGIRDVAGNTNNRVLQFGFNQAGLLNAGDLITIQQPIPEPTSLALAGLGLGSLALRYRRKKAA